MRRWGIASGLTIGLLTLWYFSYAGDVQDATTLAFVPHFHLHFPLVHVLFEPLFGAADALTISCKWQFVISFFWGLVFLAFIRNWFWRGILLSAGVVFVILTIFLPRPMTRITADDPNVLLIDFHSHTSLSHDGRTSFSTAANRRWHQKQGFNAAFITDHELISAAQQSQAESTQNWAQTGYCSLVGEEVSLWQMHFIVLGPKKRIDNISFNDNPKLIKNFIQEMNRQGLLIVGVLPYYWMNYWDAIPEHLPDDDKVDLTDFVEWGIDGLEIVNGAPRGLNFPVEKRRNVVTLCRQFNLFMTGVSDTHGYGYATPVWSAVSLPGWRSLQPEKLQDALIAHLREKKFGAVQVLERPRYRPETQWEWALSPFGVAVVYARSLHGPQVLSWLVWIWLFAAVL